MTLVIIQDVSAVAIQPDSSQNLNVLSISGGIEPYTKKWYSLINGNQQLISDEYGQQLSLTNNLNLYINNEITQYIFEATDSNGTQQTANFTVTYIAYPIIDASHNYLNYTLDLSENASLTLSNIRGGKGPLQLQWSCDLCENPLISYYQLQSQQFQFDICNNKYTEGNDKIVVYKATVKDSLNNTRQFQFNITYKAWYLVLPFILENTDIRIYDLNGNITTEKIQNIKPGDFICSKNLNKVKVKDVYMKTITANNNIYTVNINNTSIECFESAYINNYSILYSTPANMGILNESYNGQQVKLYHICCYNFANDDVYINNIGFLSYGLPSDIIEYDPVIGSYKSNTLFNQILRESGTGEEYIKPPDTRDILEETIYDPISGETITIRRIKD